MAGRFSIDTVFRARDHFSRKVLGMSRAVERFSRRARRRLAGVNRTLAFLSSGAQRFISLAGTAATAAVAGATYAAVQIGKTGADFEEAITAVGAVGLKTRDQIADLEAKAKQLGATTKFTATEAANAMEIMARAGFESKDILQGIDGVLNAAASSGLEIAEVADHVSNVLKGMGTSSEDAAAKVKKLGLTGDAAAEMIKRLTIDSSSAGRVADVLALASSKTNSTIGSLGESMRNVAATARQLNIPLEDTVASVALLQDVGLDASVAGSSLNTMLTKMAKPTDEIAAKMKKFGVTFKDANGNMLPLNKVLANISKAGDKAGGTFDKVAFFADLVGLRGQKAAGNLAKLFEEGRTSELAEQLRNAAGSAEKMSKLRLDNLKGDITLLNSAFDALKTDIYETRSGPLRGLVQGLKEWLDLNSGNISSAFTVWGERLKPYIKIFKESFMKAFEMFGSALDRTSQSPSWSKFEKVLPELAENLGMLAAAALRAMQLFGYAMAGIALAASRLMSMLRAFVGAVAEPVLQLIDIFAGMWRSIKATFDAEGPGFWSKAYEIGKTIVTGLMSALGTLPSLVWGVLKGIWGSLKKLFTGGGDIEPPSIEPPKVDLPQAPKVPQKSIAGGSFPVSLAESRAGWMQNPNASFAGAAPSQTQPAAPGGMVAPRATVIEKKETTQAEIVIRDESGKASITRAPKGKNVNLKLAPSGAF